MAHRARSHSLAASPGGAAKAANVPGLVSAALSRLIEQPAKWEKLHKEGGKFLETLRKSREQANKFIEALGELAADSADSSLGASDLGLCVYQTIDGLVTQEKAQRSYVQSLEVMLESIREKIPGLKRESDTLAADYEAGRKAAEQKIKSAEKNSAKLGALANKNKADAAELTGSLQVVADSVADASRFERNELRKIIVATRQRYCVLLHLFGDFVAQQLPIMEKSLEQRALVDVWEASAETATDVPLELESVLGDVEVTYLDVGGASNSAEAGASAPPISISSADDESGEGESAGRFHISSPTAALRRGSVMHFGENGALLSDLSKHAGMQYVAATEAEADSQQISLLDQIEENRKTGAAVLLQSWFRGSVARRELTKAGVVSARARGVAERDEAADIREGRRAPDSLPYWHDRYDDSNVQLAIQAIDVSLLMRKLTQPGVNCDELLRVFLLTHATFISSRVLLEYVVQRFWSVPQGDAGVDPVRFHEQIRAPMQLATLHLVKTWLVCNPHEFPTVGAVYSALEAFLRSIGEAADLTPGVKERAAELVLLLRQTGDRVAGARQLEPGTPASESSTGGGTGAAGTTGEPSAADAMVSLSSSRSFQLSTKAPPSILLTSRRTHTVAQLHPMEVARQLTLLDYEVFRKLVPSEFLGQSWAKKGKEIYAPYLLRMIERFNATAAWAASEVLKCDGPKYRARMLCVLIDVAKNLLVLQNFSALMAVLTGIQSAPLARLKFTWELVPEAYETHFHDLKELMSMTFNYRTYRDKLRSAKPPAVPYLGVTLQDLTFIDDGNPTFVGLAGQTLVNIEKQRMTADVIADVMALRPDGAEYCLHRVPLIIDYLERTSVKFSETKAYEISLEQEPRNMKPPPKARRKRIQYVPLDGSASVEFDLGRNAKFLDDLISRMSLVRYAPGELIIAAGEVGREMFFVSSGVVKVELPSGGEVVLGQGAFFGEIALFLDQPRTANVRAHSEVQAFMLTKIVAMEVMREYPHIEGQFKAMAEHRLAMNASDKNDEMPAWMEKLAGRAQVAADALPSQAAAGRPAAKKRRKTALQ